MAPMSWLEYKDKAFGITGASSKTRNKTVEKKHALIGRRVEICGLARRARPTLDYWETRLLAIALFLTSTVHDIRAQHMHSRNGSFHGMLFTSAGSLTTDGQLGGVHLGIRRMRRAVL